MDKKTNVFLTHTEYHLLQSINIAVSLYASSGFLNRIYIPKTEKRFKEITVKDKFSHKNIELIVLDHPSDGDLIRLILEQKIDHFFFFQAISVFNLYLINKLSKRGAKISLGPDGYGSYVVWKKDHEFLSMLKDTVRGFRQLWRAGIIPSKIIWMWNYRYASNPLIQLVWLSPPDQYVHRFKNKIKLRRLPMLNEESHFLIDKLFGFHQHYLYAGAVYYFNQPFWTNELIDREMRFLREMLDCFNEIPFYIKMHPLTPSATLALYRTLPGVIIIESTVPAEVILTHLKDCIVFTGWSTALMMENKQCNYYFNYPIYKGYGAKSVEQSSLIILEHINVVSSPKEMKFPHE